MMQTEGIVLGHHVSQTGIKVEPAKIEVISQILILNSQKEVRSFLEHAWYCRRSIENFTRLATPMFKLLARDVDFSCDTDYQNAFQVLKDTLSTVLVLRGPNWSLPFHICIDASNTTLGAMLGQRENQIPYAIYFVGKNISPTKLNYTATENELLAVVHAIKKFRHYITDYEFFFHIDHSTIIFLLNKHITDGRIKRWSLLVQNLTLL